MATPAHAFFCFEVLVASFDDSPHPSLKKLLDLYEDKNNRASGQSSSATEQVNQDAQSVSEVMQQYNEQDTPQLRSIALLQNSASPARSASSTPSIASAGSSVSRTASSTTTDVTTASSYASSLAVTESFPVFVTWNNISRSGRKSLRGCIGTFDPLPLEKGLEQYAITSAFEDTRFSPIAASSVPNLSCSLTLLADFEDCEYPLDWELGTHGVRISFTYRFRRYGATYLPDVALEQGWTKEETLESLMRKAGWEPGTRRPLRPASQPWEEVKDFHVVRYTGLKASASYTEWQQWRRSVGL